MEDSARRNASWKGVHEFKQRKTKFQSMKTNLKSLGLPILLAATLSVVGCRSTGEGGRTAGRVLDDDNITDRVQTALHDAPTYKFDGVNVSTYGGVVQLSGWVTTQDQKSAAGQIAQNHVQSNVKVINNISIYDTSDKTKSAEEPRAVGGTPSDKDETPPR